MVRVGYSDSYTTRCGELPVRKSIVVTTRGKTYLSLPLSKKHGDNSESYLKAKVLNLGLRTKGRLSLRALCLHRR